MPPAGRLASLAAAALAAASCAAPPPSPPPPPPPPVHPVNDRAGLERARVQAEAALEALLGIRVEAPRLSLYLVEARELLERAGRGLADPRLQAFTEVEETFHDDRLALRIYRTFVLRGLGEAELVGVVAHELFHVWQVESGGGVSASEAFREGAALWAQVEVHRWRGEEALAGRLARDAHPTYASGRRRFARLVEAEGLAAALGRAARERDFPPGF